MVFGDLDSGVKDRNGDSVFAGDTLRFVDKWEWHRGKFGGGWLATQSDYNEVLNDHEKYPYQDRVVELPKDYDWLLSSEIQSHWEIVKK